MTPEQFQKASGIITTIASYKRELQNWQAHGHDVIVCPLRLRTGEELHYVPTRLYVKFMAECQANLQTEIKKLEEELSTV